MTDHVVLTCRERDVRRYNRRGQRPGIYGQSIDSATGRELDRQALVFNVVREPARLFGFQLPWRQSDEALRRRVFLKCQADSAPGPCGHNVWAVIADRVNGDYTMCDDCGERLCWVSPAQAARIVWLTTRSVGDP